MGEIGGEKRQPLGLVAVRVDQHDRAASGLLSKRQPGVSAERDQVIRLTACISGSLEMRPGKRKNSDGVSPLAIRSRSVSRISSSGSTPFVSRKFASSGSLR